MTNDNLSFGQMIRDRRRLLELTQEELAARIRTSTPTSVISSPVSAIHPMKFSLASRMYSDSIGANCFFVANPTTARC